MRQPRYSFLQTTVAMAVLALFATVLFPGTPTGASTTGNGALEAGPGGSTRYDISQATGSDAPEPTKALVPPLSTVGKTPGQTDAPTATGDQWYELGVQAGDTLNCTIIGGWYIEPLGMSYVGYYGNITTNPIKPATNQVYYTKVGWGVTGFPCGTGGAQVHIEVGFPAGTQPAISSTNKVRCFYKAPGSNTYTDYTNDPDCPQQPGTGLKGGLSFDPPSTGTWPTATGAASEVWIPVKSSQPLDGLMYTYPTPCPSCLIAGVWMMDGSDSPWSYPMKGVAVSGAATTAPIVFYPSPSMTAVAYDSVNDWSTATMNGYVDTKGSVGNAYFKIGRTTAYEELTTPNITVSPAGTWHFYQPIQGIEPGVTYHWRACYDATSPDLAVVCGADQTFAAEPRPDTAAPTTTIVKGPSGWVRSKNATFEFDSNETNVQFLCRLDDAATGFTGCPLGTKPMYSGLAQGGHTLEVKAKDAAGNVGTPVSRTWKVDTVPPETKITSGPSGTVKSRRAEFKFTSSEKNSRFQCSLDGSRFKACTSPKVYTNLKRTKHFFRVKARDAAGNFDPTAAKRTWTIK